MMAIKYKKAIKYIYINVNNVRFESLLGVTKLSAANAAANTLSIEELQV